MSVQLSTAEIRKMPAKELLREAEERKLTIAKLDITIKMGKEKDTSKLRKERRTLARILTVLGQGVPALKETASSATVSAPSRTTTAKRKTISPK